VAGTYRKPRAPTPMESGSIQELLLTMTIALIRCLQRVGLIAALSVAEHDAKHGSTIRKSRAPSVLSKRGTTSQILSKPLQISATVLDQERTV
jgi:hypothetical protein